MKHRQPVTSVALADDDSRGFSASKDGVIMHWDVESGKSEKYLWPREDVLVSHYAKPLQNSARKRSKNVLALTVSSDGRYLASGGMDRHVHLWDTRTREHLQVSSRWPLSFCTTISGYNHVDVLLTLQVAAYYKCSLYVLQIQRGNFGISVCTLFITLVVLF